LADRATSASRTAYASCTKVARAEWTVEGHTVTQVPDDGFAVIVIGEITDMQPRDVFLRIFDANGALLGRAGERAGHEYDLPGRSLPVGD
jgi:hypothetical protein